MLLKPANQVQPADIEALVKNQVSEGKHVEYKQTLPSGSSNDRKEFLADVTSFANSVGGHIIYGISEKIDQNSKNTGEPDELAGVVIGNLDQEILRLDQLIRSGVDPVVPGFLISAIGSYKNGPALIISIPQSWNGPHMVTLENSSKFYTRTNRGKAQMEYSEIKNSFLGGDSLSKKLRDFRIDRIAKIKANEGSLPLVGESKFVFHAIPIEVFQGRRLTIPEIRSGFDGIAPLSHNGYQWRINVDGFFQHWSQTKKDTNTATHYSYVQMFTNGVFEAADGFLLDPKFDSKNKEIWTPGTEQKIGQAFQSFMNAAAKIGFGPPYVIAVSLLNVKGFSLGTNNFRRKLDGREFIDREDLLLPEVVVVDGNKHPLVELRPVFDSLWNALGHPKCPHYKQDGDWAEEKE